MDMHAQLLYDDFVESLPVYRILEKEARKILDGIIRDAKMYVVGVESRVKQPSSLAGKLELKGYKYKSIRDITDLVGLRVITFYSDEVDKVSSLVESRFNIDWGNSVDKRRLYSGENVDRFGYMSIHYIVTIPKETYFDPEHPELNEIPCEIQIRTALQHVWANAHHDTGYKSDIAIPTKYRREMNQLAGMLEIADNAFSRMLTEITEYRRRVSQLVANGDFGLLELDGDTFSSFIKIGPFDELNGRIAGINKAELMEASFENYLPLLKSLGFTSIGDVVKMRDEYSEMAYHLALIQLSETDLDILASTVGLQNLCLVYIYAKGGGIFGIKDFYDTINGRRDRNIQSAERTMKQLERVKII